SRPNAKTATVAPKEKEEWLVAPSGSELAQCAGQTSKGLYASPPLSLAEAPESNRRIAQRSGKGPQRAMGSRTHGPLFSPQRGLQARCLLREGNHLKTVVMNGAALLGHNAPTPNVLVFLFARRLPKAKSKQEFEFSPFFFL